MIYQLLNLYKNVWPLHAMDPLKPPFFIVPFEIFHLTSNDETFHSRHQIFASLFSTWRVVWVEILREKITREFPPFGRASCDLQVKRMAEDLIWFPVLHPEVLQRGPKWWEVMGSMLILWWAWVEFESMTWHTLQKWIFLDWNGWFHWSNRTRQEIFSYILCFLSLWHTIFMECSYICIYIHLFIEEN